MLSQAMEDMSSAPAGADAPTTDQPISKRAAKRAAKREERDAELQEKKKQRAAEVAERETARAAAQDARFAAMSDAERAEVERLRDAKRSERAKEKAAADAAFVQLCGAGCRVAIDCDFEALMTEREVKSSCQQLMYCYGANRRAAAPSRVLLSGLTGNMAAQMRNINGFESWLATDVEERPLEELFATAADRAQLVYLTAEAEAVLDRPDPAKTYVIGGFVDRNRHKGLTRDKAARLGLATARLPIGADMPIVLGDASKVLTINHVFELLVRVQASGDWADAAACLPGRKQRAGEVAAPAAPVAAAAPAGVFGGCGIM